MPIRTPEEADLIKSVREIHRDVAGVMTDDRIEEEIESRKKGADKGDIIDQVALTEYEVEAARRGLVSNPDDKDQQYMVRDNRTGKLRGPYKNRTTALRAADRIDLKYGAYIASVEPVKKNPKKGPWGRLTGNPETQRKAKAFLRKNPGCEEAYWVHALQRVDLPGEMYRHYNSFWRDEESAIEQAEKHKDRLNGLESIGIRRISEKEYDPSSPQLDTSFTPIWAWSPASEALSRNPKKGRKRKVAGGKVPKTLKRTMDKRKAKAKKNPPPKHTPPKRSRRRLPTLMMGHKASWHDVYGDESKFTKVIFGREWTANIEEDDKGMDVHFGPTETEDEEQEWLFFTSADESDINDILAEVEKRIRDIAKNPCIGLHFHAKDAEDLIEAMEKSAKMDSRTPQKGSKKKNPIEVETFDYEGYTDRIKGMTSREMIVEMDELQAEPKAKDPVVRAKALIIGQELADRATAVLGIPREVLEMPKGNPKKKAKKKGRRRNPSQVPREYDEIYAGFREIFKGENRWEDLDEIYEERFSHISRPAFDWAIEFFNETERYTLSDDGKKIRKWESPTKLDPVSVRGVEFVGHGTFGPHDMNEYRVLNDATDKITITIMRDFDGREGWEYTVDDYRMLDRGADPVVYWMAGRRKGFRTQEGAIKDALKVLDNIYALRGAGPEEMLSYGEVYELMPPPPGKGGPLVDIIDLTEEGGVYKPGKNPRKNPKKKAKKKVAKKKTTKKKASKKKAAKKKTLRTRAKKAGRKIERGAKDLAVDVERGAEKTGRKLKKFGGTKTGYATIGAGTGALLLGPLGAVVGAIGASKLHDNPGPRDEIEFDFGYEDEEGNLVDPDDLRAHVRKVRDLAKKIGNQFIKDEGFVPDRDTSVEDAVAVYLAQQWELVLQPGEGWLGDPSYANQVRNAVIHYLHKQGYSGDTIYEMFDNGAPAPSRSGGRRRPPSSHPPQPKGLAPHSRGTSPGLLGRMWGSAKGNIYGLFEDDGTEPNPRKKKKSSKLKKKAKKAGRKAKKFAKTKEGYAAGGAGVGALLLGPLGAVAGAVGGSALHGNPGIIPNPTQLNEQLRVELPDMPDEKVVELFSYYDDMYRQSHNPVQDFGEEGVELVRSVIRDTKSEMRKRGLKAPSRTNPKKRRRKNPTKNQHHALGDRRWNMFEDAWDSYSVSNSPEDLLGAWSAVLEAEVHYNHAGIENDEGRGYGPAGEEAEGIRAQLIERLGG